MRMPWPLSGLCSVDDALFQAVFVCTAAFTPVNAAVGIEIDVSVRPFWRDTDTVMAPLVAPPIQLHEKVFVWKDKAIIRSTASGLHPSFVYPMLHVPDVLEFFLAVFGVMHGYCRLKKGLPHKK